MGHDEGEGDGLARAGDAADEQVVVHHRQVDRFAGLVDPQVDGVEHGQGGPTGTVSGVDTRRVDTRWSFQGLRVMG